MTSVFVTEAGENDTPVRQLEFEMQLPDIRGTLRRCFVDRRILSMTSVTLYSRTSAEEYLNKAICDGLFIDWTKV